MALRPGSLTTAAPAFVAEQLRLLWLRWRSLLWWFKGTITSSCPNLRKVSEGSGPSTSLWTSRPDWRRVRRPEPQFSPPSPSSEAWLEDLKVKRVTAQAVQTKKPLVVLQEPLKL